MGPKELASFENAKVPSETLVEDDFVERPESGGEFQQTEECLFASSVAVHVQTYTTASL